MNCDLVFEILTRGPFPAGQPTDASVELHLNSCYECRQLAEALRPATSLIHEAFDDPDIDLPGYHGDLPVMAARPSAVASAVEAAITEIAQETSEDREQAPVEVIVRKKPAWQRPRFAMLPFSLAMLAASIVAATLVGMQWNEPGNPTNLTSDPPGKSKLALTLASLPTACECLPLRADLAMTATASQCCKCHIQPQHKTAPSSSLADKSFAVCSTCHTE